jgi:hypothetical protein
MIPICNSRIFKSTVHNEIIFREIASCGWTLLCSSNKCYEESYENNLSNHFELIIDNIKNFLFIIIKHSIRFLKYVRFIIWKNKFLKTEAHDSLFFPISVKGIFGFIFTKLKHIKLILIKASYFIA